MITFKPGHITTDTNRICGVRMRNDAGEDQALPILDLIVLNKMCHYI